VILLDDVLTGGGHLQAAAWVLEDAGAKIGEALCCGRSLDTQLENPFMVDDENIDLSRLLVDEVDW
jgi:adenine/guanine phosphoribosyltransferase-like PRPP-binding protein